MEIGLKVLAEAPFTGEVRHTCTAYLTFVKLRAGGDEPLPPLEPVTSEERAHQAAAATRQAERLKRVERLRAGVAADGAW
jgi:acyl-CoA hydrolase